MNSDTKQKVKADTRAIKMEVKEEMLESYDVVCKEDEECVKQEIKSETEEGNEIFILESLNYLTNNE